MTQQFKRRLKRVVLSIFTCLFVGLILLSVIVVTKLKSHTPIMAYDALAVALERGGQQEIIDLTTPTGFKQLQNITSLHGQRRLGHYLTKQKPVNPYLHAPVTAAVLLGNSKDFDVVVFFKWTWNGWKLVGISGTPVFH